MLIALKELFSDPTIKKIDLCAYAVHSRVIEELGLQAPGKRRVRLLAYPSGGTLQSDINKLRAWSRPESFEIRAIPSERSMHSKLALIHRDGKAGVIAVIGSANWTGPGIGLHPASANEEISAIMYLEGADAKKLVGRFNELWSSGCEATDELFYERLDGASINLGYEDLDHRPVTLLDYQRAVLESNTFGRGLIDLYKNRGKPGEANGVIVSMPPATGKTLTAAHFIVHEVLNKAEAGDRPRRVLWLAPQIELLGQAWETFHRLRAFIHDGLHIQPEDEIGEDIDSDEVPYAVCFMTHAMAHGKYKESRNETDAFAVVVVDEAHWGASKDREYLNSILPKLKNAFRIALTGTPYRSKNNELDDIFRLFDRRLIHVPESVAQAAVDSSGRKVLAKVRPLSAKAVWGGMAHDSEELSQMLPIVDSNDQGSLGDFITGKTSRAIAEAWDRKAHGKTLVFAMNIAHAKSLAKAFRESSSYLKTGRRLQVVHSGALSDSWLAVRGRGRGGRLTVEDRMRIRRRFREQEEGIDVLIAVRMYIAGIDVPAIKTLFMATPTRSRVTYAQMLGRGQRGPAFGGTEEVQLLDFALQMDAHERFKKTLINHQTFLANMNTEDEADHARQLLLATKKIYAEGEVNPDHYDDVCGAIALFTPTGKLVDDEVKVVKNIKRCLDLLGPRLANYRIWIAKIDGHDRFYDVKSVVKAHQDALVRFLKTRLDEGR